MCLVQVWRDVRALFGPTVVFVLGGPGAGKGRMKLVRIKGVRCESHAALTLPMSDFPLLSPVIGTLCGRIVEADRFSGAVKTCSSSTWEQLAGSAWVTDRCATLQNK